jgi:catechol 2,3-dioxygenase-like lactoylglutathione lyase family enzyme
VSGVVEIARFTDDVDAVKRFYADVANVPPDAEWPGGAVFALGGVKLLVHERAVGMEDGPPNEDHFAVGVTNLDATCEDLVSRGYAFLLEPRDYPWGRSAYLRDPDGRLLELSQTYGPRSRRGRSRLPVP